MTRGARIVFVALVVATVAAFFVAQRLKNAPPAIQGVSVNGDVKTGLDRSFSPVAGGSRDTMKIRFRVKRATPVTVQVVDDQQETVATLARDLRLKAYRGVRLRWNGRRGTSPGAEGGEGRYLAGRVLGEGTVGPLARDGRYYVRITLPDEGRSVVVPTAATLDTVPPRPRVARTTPGTTPVAASSRRVPAVVSPGDPVLSELRLGGYRPSARVVSTDTAGGSERVVRELEVRPSAGATAGTKVGGATRVTRGTAAWDGRLADGRRAPVGTYVVQACLRDVAGNVGCTATPDGRSGLPRRDRDGRYGGRGGVTVRDVRVTAPALPVPPGEPLVFRVDAGGGEYSWALRRVDGRQRGTVESGTARGATLSVKPRSDRPGGYVLVVRRGGTRIEAPAVVTATDPQRVLVVLPALTWQGENPVDDDGDGATDTLGQGPRSRIRALRPYAATPTRFGDDVEPVLAWLARTGRTYDVTTDLALALAAEPGGGRERPGPGGRIAGHRGVLLVGEQRWTTPAVAAALRGVVAKGGTVAALHPGSLHRTVRARASGLVSAPGPFDAVDALGVTSPGPSALRGPLQSDQDALGLFDGTSGRLGGYRAGWVAGRLEGGRRVSSAVDDRDRVVVAGIRRGAGYVLRTGLPDFASRVDRDETTTTILRNAWRRLSR